jgi:hypothetical protein
MKTSFAFVSLAILVAAHVSAQDYAIKMHQPLKVGQRYKFTAVGIESSENSMTSQERVLKNQKEELTLEMESQATVLAVDAKGRPTKESHTVVKLLQGAGKEPMLAAGTIVIASRPGRKTVFEIGGETATSAVAKALDLAVSITSGGPTDDEIFGTTERKKVGDRWSVNEALALKDSNEKLSTAGMSVESVKGTTTLQKVTKDGSVEVIHLLGNMTATMSATAKGPFTFADSTMTATFTGAFPADITKSVREEGLTMTMVLKASGKPNPEGPVVQISSNLKRSVTRQFKLHD